jgi:hypothetical protein
MAGTVLVTATIPTGMKASYQWFRSGVAITGATRTSYSIKSDDVSKDLSIKVIFTKTGYLPATLTSSAVTVTPGTLAKTAIPTTSGIKLVGKSLTATTGIWDSGTTFSYQWLRNGVPISGATTKSYKLVSQDLGSAIGFRIIATKPGYIPVTNFSIDTSVISY